MDRDASPVSFIGNYRLSSLGDRSWYAGIFRPSAEYRILGHQGGKAHADKGVALIPGKQQGNHSQVLKLNLTNQHDRTSTGLRVLRFI